MPDEMTIVYADDEATWPKWLRDYRNFNDCMRECFRFAYPGLAKFADHILSDHRAAGIPDGKP